MGIDTIQFNTSDFELDICENHLSKYPFTLIPNKIPPMYSANMEQFQNDLIIDKNGIQIKGLRLQNTEPMKETGIVQISSFTNPKTNTNTPFLKVACSVPKYMNGQNFYTSNKTEYKRFLEQVETDLREIGIKTDVKNCSVSRLDLTENVFTDFPYFEYLPILNNSQSERYKCRDYGKSTFLCGNHSRQVCCYDKIDCMKELEENIPTEIINENVFRCENRLLKKDVIQKYDIITNQNIITNFDSMKDIYKENVKKILFNNSAEILKQDCKNFDSNFERYLQSGNTRFETFITDCLLSESKNVIETLRNNLEHYLELEKFFNESNGMGKDSIKSIKARHKKKWTETLNQMLGKLVQNGQNIPLEQLYNELYEKLLVA